MAHRIGKHDRQDGIELAWHKLTNILPIAKNGGFDLRKSFLAEWDVVKSGLLRPNGSASKYCELVCTDDPELTIGEPVHCQTYVPVTNAAFLDLVSDAMDKIPGAAAVSAGSVCDRGRIFVSIRVPEVAELTAAGREFKPYLNFLSSHDQSAAFFVNASTVCTVCNNTFSFNLNDKENKALRIKVKHTKNVLSKLENVPEMVDAFCGTAARFCAIMDSLAESTVAADNAERFFAGLLTVKDESAARKFLTGTRNLSAEEKKELAPSTRRANQIARLTELFRTGAGNKGENRADVFSAVTDYYTHESSGGEDISRQIESSEFGAGQAAKARAFDILQNDSLFNLFSNVGDTVLSFN